MSFGPNVNPPPTLPKPRRSISPLGCIAIAFGVLLLGIIVVGIVGAVALARSVRKSDLARKESGQWQLPPGKPIDSSVKQSFSKAGISPPQDPGLAEIQELFSESSSYGAPDVDLDRFIAAIEQSNAAELDWLTRSMLKVHVTDEYFNPPWFSANNKVLHAEWTKKGEEARVFVLGESEFTDSTTIYVLWLTRRDGSWKLYDSKDILDSLSEADYLAFSNFLMDGESYVRFQQSIDGLRDASQIAQYALSARVEKPFKDMALVYALSSLENLGAWEEMEQLALTIDPQKCRYGLRFLARIASQKKDYQRVLDNHRKLSEEFGWFPGLPQMLGAWKPSNAEDQLFVRHCLVRELYIVGNDYPLKNQVETYGPELLSELADFIQPASDKSSIVERLFGDGALANQESIQHMLDCTDGKREFDTIRPQLKGLLAYHQKDWELAASLLCESIDARLKLLKPEEALPPQFRCFVDSILKSKDPLEHCRKLKEKRQFAEQFLWQVSTIPDRSTSQMTQLLDWIESQKFELERPFLVPFVRARGLQETDPDQSMKLALQVHKEIMESIVGLGVEGQPLTMTELAFDYETSSPRWVARQLYELMSELTSSDEIWLQYREELGAPDIALLLRAKQSNLPCRLNDLSEAIQWYATAIGNDEDGEPWMSYYKSRIAFCQGKWEEADQQIRRSISKSSEIGSWDVVATSWFSIDEIFQLEKIRASTALRCSRGEDYLIRVLEEEGESSWARVSESLRLLTDIRHAKLLPDIAKLKAMAPQDDKYLEMAFDEYEFIRSIGNGEHGKAWQLGLAVLDQSIELSTGMMGQSSEGFPLSSFNELLDVGLATGRLEELDLSKLDPQQRGSFKAVLAIFKKEVGMFRAALDAFELESNGIYELGLYSMPHAQAAIFENGWSRILAEYRLLINPESKDVRLCLIPFDDKRMAKDVAESIASALSKIDQDSKSIEAGNVDHCVAAWRLSESQLSSTILLLDQEASVALGKSNSCWPTTNWTLAIQMPTMVNSSDTIASALIEVAKSLVDVRGFWESDFDSFVSEPNWKEFGESGEPFSLIGPLSSSATELFVETDRNVLERVVQGDEVSLQVSSRDILSELVRAKVISDPDEHGYVEIELLESSVLSSKLTAGCKVIHWEDYLFAPD